MSEHLTELRVQLASENDLPPHWPCEIVRRAARLMKQRAAEATPGPWRVHDTHLNHGGHTATVLSGEGDATKLCAWLPTWNHEPWDGAHNAWNNAYQIAAIADPDVARAIADSWEHLADDMCDGLAHFHAFGPPGGWVVEDRRDEVRHAWTATVRAALKYLREDAPKAVDCDV